jgi:hypothetical protein
MEICPGVGRRVPRWNKEDRNKEQGTRDFGNRGTGEQGIFGNKGGLGTGDSEF